MGTVLAVNSVENGYPKVVVIINDVVLILDLISQMERIWNQSSETPSSTLTCKDSMMTHSQVMSLGCIKVA